MANFSTTRTYTWCEIRDNLPDPHMTSYYVEYYFDRVGDNQYRTNAEAVRVTPITNALERMNCLNYFDSPSRKTWKAGVGWVYN